MPDMPVTPSGGAAEPQTPAAAAPSAPQYVGREELAGFSEQIAKALQTHAESINQQVMAWGRAVGAPARQGQTAQPAAAPASASEEKGLLMRIAEGDYSGIDQRVIETLKGTGLIDHLATQAQNAAAANEASARAAVDAEFGDGTYEKQLKPIVDRILGDSVTARSNPQTVNNAVAAAKGQRFSELVTARTAKEKAVADARAAEEARIRAQSPWMPGNGFLPAAPNTLDEADSARLKRIGEQTGGNVPKPEEAAKLRDLAYRKGVDGVSMEDLAELFPTAGRSAA